LELFINAMEIRIPKLNDLRLVHLEAIKGLKERGLNAYDKLELVHKLTGVGKDSLMDKSLKDIDRVINAYFELFAKIDKSNPDKEIELNGQKFVLVDKFSRMPMGWHIDASAFDLSDLSVLMAFCYIEKGMKHGEVDKHKNIINPVMKRAALFKEYLPMEHYVKAGFFLTKKAENYTRAFTEIRRQRSLNMKSKNTNGKEQLI